MALIIKGIYITDATQLVFVPIAARTVEELLPLAARATRNGAALLEWRADAFAEWQDSARVREALSMLQRFTDSAILLVSLRTRALGGSAAADADTLWLTYDAIAQSHSADLLDVEYEVLGTKAETILRQLHERGQLVVTTAGLNGTDISENTENGPAARFARMEDLDADVGHLIERAETPALERNLWKIFI